MSDDFGFGGFFELRTAVDLLEKLRHDRARLAANPRDSYAAFDFFVTANCLVDWTWPSAGRGQQRANRRTDVLPRICEHLADGAKHFLLLVPHRGVEKTLTQSGAFDPAIFDPAVFDTADKLVVRLEEREAQELGTNEITALELADRVLAYWTRRLG
jgi:hypothetical protein